MFFEFPFFPAELWLECQEGGEVGLRRRDVDGGLALLKPHKLAGEFFSPTLQQQTKTKMEKSFCMLAVVIFLGGFLDAAGALIDDKTESYSLLNNTATAESVTVEPQNQGTDRPTPTTAQTKLSTTTVRDKQLDTKSNSQDSKEENNKKEETDDRNTEEKKQELGRTKHFSSRAYDELPGRLQAD